MSAAGGGEREGFLGLPDRVALVTGGGSGIGLAIAERLATAGARVVVADADRSRGEAGAEQITSRGGEALAVTADVTSAEATRDMVAQTLDAFGQLDVLVNNAGIGGRAGPMWELDDEDWHRVLAVNLTGVWNCCRAAIGHMRERRRGAIVNVASVSGKEGNPGMLPYSTSKAGVICLTKALAKEVIGEGIRVNAVAPGVVETPLLGDLTPEAVEYMRSKVPMGRMGTSEEVAAVVHFLAADDASFVTGQCYDVSGGRATY